MEQQITIDSDLIELNLDFKNKDDAIRFLGMKLFNQGFVHQDFTERIVERENNYPTGLPTSIPLAICHTEAKYVINNAIAVAVLKNPIAFKEMGNPENEVPVKILFILALNDPKTQVLWLRKFAKIFQDKKTLRQIDKCNSKVEIEKKLKEILIV